MARSGTTRTGLVILVLCMLVHSLQATVFTVGEGRGWVVGVDYNVWAKLKKFKAGDLLVFDYSSAYSVDEVFENDYKTCNTDHPISSDRSGSTAIPLITAGPRYFICGVPGYCSQGMKLLVDVTA